MTEQQTDNIDVKDALLEETTFSEEEPRSSESNEELEPQRANAPEKKIAPRPAQRIRRRRKTSGVRRTARNQQAIQAAVMHAVEAKELSEIQSVRSSPVSTFANSLEAYAQRQDQAIENMRAQSSPQSDSSLKNSSIQLKDIQDIEVRKAPAQKGSIESVKGRRSVHTETRLTPLSARPGAAKSVESKPLNRESASRKQSEPSIENKLSIWEIEDRERLRKELEEGKQ